jgi:hypothetical protein
MTTRQHVKQNFPNLQTVGAPLIKQSIDLAALSIDNCGVRVESLVIGYEPSTGKAATWRLTRAFGVVSGTVTAYGTTTSTSQGDSSLTPTGVSLDVQLNKPCTSITGLVGKTINWVVWDDVYTTEL